MWRGYVLSRVILPFSSHLSIWYILLKRGYHRDTQHAYTNATKYIKFCHNNQVTSFQFPASTFQIIEVSHILSYKYDARHFKTMPNNMEMNTTQDSDYQSTVWPQLLLLVKPLWLNECWLFFPSKCWQWDKLVWLIQGTADSQWQLWTTTVLHRNQQSLWQSVLQV